MSSPRYPLYNIRKNAYGVWQQVHETGETVVVPGSASNYCIRLLEVPDNGSVHAKPLITGLTRSELYPPSAGQFWVNYSTGEVVFSSELEGQTFDVDYWKRGSLVDVDDINLLYNRIIEFDRDPNNLDDGYEVGTLCVNTSANEYFICVNNTDDNAIWIPRVSGGTSGTSGTSSSLPAYIHLQTTPASSWTISHNKGSQYPLVEVYDTSNNTIIPYSVFAQDTNTLIISFDTELVAGRAVLTFASGVVSGTSGGSGIDGSSGTSGISGTSGTSGESGSSGTSGSSGESGSSGTSGSSGESGSSGTSGTSGATGTSGESGSSGTSGTSGIDGSSGTSGSSGESGSSGTSGTSGATGTSGESGTSGTSGVGVPTGGTAGQVLAKIDGTDYNTQWVDAPTGTGGTGGVPGTSGTSGTTVAGSAFTMEFTNSDLTSGGILRVTHNFGFKYTAVAIYDNMDRIIIPQEVSAIDEDTVDIDLSTFYPISGTWHASITYGAPLVGPAGTSGTSGTSSVGGYYHTSFDNTALSAGILTVNHNLGNMFVVVAIYDEMNRFVLPQEINLTTIDIAEVDLSTYGVINGTWNVVVTF